MSNGFDAYHKWLSIPPHDQPPNHYRLLGLGLFESDPDVVAAAADRQMAHVQTYKTGPHSELSQKLLNEISAAKLCLLRPQKKGVYDEQLRQQMAASPAGTGGLANGMGAATIGSPSNGPPANGSSPTMTPPAGTPSMAAARMSNPAPFANVESENAIQRRPGAMAGATTAGGPRGMPYPGYANSPIAPPPPTLPPPVADASLRPLIGTMTILITAGVVAILLLIGIVVALRHRSDHGQPSTSVEKSDATPNADASKTTDLSPPQNQGSQITSVPGQASSFQSGLTPSPSGIVKPDGTQGTSSPPPKSSGFPATVDHGKKPPTQTGDVATNLPPGKVPPDKNHPDTTPPAKTIPDKPIAVKPAVDPALAGKTTVPDKAAIAAVEQRLGNAAEATVSAADLMDQAHKAGQAAEIYVLLHRAVDSAVKQGDAATAISAVDELARRFAVDSLEVRLQTLNDLQSRVVTSEALDAVAEAAAALIDEATTAAKPDVAEQLAEMSITLARKSGNAEVLRKITLRIVHMRAAPAPVPNSLPPSP